MPLTEKRYSQQNIRNPCFDGFERNGNIETKSPILNAFPAATSSCREQLKSDARSFHTSSNFQNHLEEETACTECLLQDVHMTSNFQNHLEEEMASSESLLQGVHETSKFQNHPEEEMSSTKRLLHEASKFQNHPEEEMSSTERLLQYVPMASNLQNQQEEEMTSSESLLSDFHMASNFQNHPEEERDSTESLLQIVHEASSFQNHQEEEMASRERLLQDVHEASRFQNHPEGEMASRERLLPETEGGSVGILSKRARQTFSPRLRVVYSCLACLQRVGTFTMATRHSCIRRERFFGCRLCHRVYSRPDTLHRHMKSHLDSGVVEDATCATVKHSRDKVAKVYGLSLRIARRLVLQRLSAENVIRH